MNLSQFISKNPKLETDRLIIRKLIHEDAFDMYSYASRPETARYLLWEPHPSLNYTRDLIHYLQKEYSTGNYSDFAIIFKENNKMIGTVGFTSFDEKNLCAEVGYVINPDYWHQGIATEALNAILSVAFYDLDAERVEAKYMPENIYSKKVMEKCGMTYEGTARHKMYIKGKFCDIAFCSVLREEYFSLHEKKQYSQTKKTKRICRIFDFSHKN